MARFLLNKWGEATVGYIWTGWVWDITNWGEDFKKITDHLRGIYIIYLELVKKNKKISTCKPVGFFVFVFVFNFFNFFETKGWQTNSKA